jgi:alkanesulfonate monooxygenase SsuD/methylene tetrahydromethanopterin reductase-like flavin-dependent oxidoreductase (luciferase family)
MTRDTPAERMTTRIGLTASGTPNEVVQRVERYREAGVTLPILRPAARHQTTRVIDLFTPR